MDKVEVKFGEWLQEAFELLKANFVLLMLTNLIALVLSVVTVGILAGPMMAGVAMITLALIDKREPKPVPGDIFKGFEFFLPSFLLVLLVLCVVAASAAAWLFVGPLSGVAAWVLLTLTMFSIFLIVEKKMDFWPAVQASYEIVKTAFWPLLGLVVVSSIAVDIGLVARCVGIVATAPFFMCAMSVAYRHVSAAAPAPAEPQKPVL